MAAFDFPSSPNVNDIYTLNGVAFMWNGSVWKRYSTSTGAQGFQGAAGAAGAQGAQGTNGTIGSDGAQGAQGHQGATGSGATGAQGAAGAQGATGAAGAQGAPFDRSEYNYTASGGQTAFAAAYANASDVDVFMNGVRLTPAEYTASGGTTITLASGATAGDIIDILTFASAGPTGAQGAQGAQGDAFNRSESNFTATSGQTSFAPSGGYTNGDDLDVFVNGVRLTPADYTATNGTNVVLDVGANTGDIVDIIYYEAAGPAGAQGAAGIAGTVTFSTGAPSNPTNGDLWYDTDDGAFAGYYNDGNTSQWIDLSGGPRGAQGAAGAQGATGSIPSNITAVSGTFSGNVSIGGTLTYEDVTNIDSVGVVTARAGVKVPDSQKIFLGTGDDLQIYHNGSHSFVENSTGELLIRAKAGENSINCYPDGSVELFHNNSKKFETTSYGSNVTGDLRITDNSARLQLYDANASSNTQCTGGFEVYDQNGNRGAWIGLTESASSIHFGIYGSDVARIASDGTLNLDYGAINLGAADSSSGHINAYELMTFNIDSDNDDTNRYFAWFKDGFNGGGTELARLTETGNLGIGENSPYYKLHVETNNSQTSLSGGTSGNWGGDGIRIENTNATGGSMVLAHFRNYDADWHIGGKYVGANDSDFVFLAEGSEKLRITSDGDMGLGTATPTSFGPTFQISGADPALLLQDTATAVDYYGMNIGNGHVTSWFDDSAYFAIGTAAGISGASYSERLRVDSDGRLMIGQTSAYSATGTGTMMLTVTKNASNRTDVAISNQFSGDNGSAAIVLATHGQDYILEATGSGNTTDGTRAFRILKGNDERFRIDNSGNKYTHYGAIGHGSGDYSNFASAGRTSYNNISIRAGQQNAGTTPTNSNSAIKIYPAGVRSTTTGNLTGGIAWQHLDPDNGTWDTNYGPGAQIWMGAALHDTPGQERDRFNLWMNSQTAGGSQPNNLAIEAYPNGMVRFPKVPAFYAYTVSNPNLTSAGDQVFTNTRLNNGSCYSTSNGRFTAPINGMYLVSTSVQLYGQGSGVSMSYRINGTDFHGSASTSQPVYDERAGSHTQLYFTAVVSMSQNDYITVWTNNGIRGMQGYFTGHLVG